MMHISKQNKWVEFKKKRLEIIDKYIQARKVQIKCQNILKILFLRKFLSKVSDDFNESLHKYEMMIKAKFMSVVICHRWAARQKRFGPCIHQVNRRDFRKHITFLSMTSNVVYKRQAKHLFTSFCESVIDNIKLNKKFTKYFEQIIWMQIKIKDQLLTRLSKVDVLMNYWDKMLGQIQMKASKTKDKKATALCRQIILVPKEVQYSILKKYVSACRLLYAIAFTQWRLEYPSELRYEEDELNEILE